MRLLISLLTVLTLIFFLGIGCAGSSLKNKNLSAGEKLFRSRCSTCHKLPNPNSRTNSEWETMLTKHLDRAKLTEQNKIAILQYLNPDSAKSASSLPE